MTARRRSRENTHGSGRTADGMRDIQAFIRERVIPADGTRYGLVVGVEKYEDPRLNLRCARADAKAMYELMTDADCGLFAKENVALLLDGDATRDKIWRAFSAMRRAASSNDTVWVYYAGHAAPEESCVYWVTHEADVDDLYGTGLSGAQIAQVLGDIRAGRLVTFLDCCHAAAASLQRDPTRDVPSADEMFACYSGRGQLTFASSDGREKSVELGDVGRGAFTYFLEKGLRGEADADGDGVVTAAELWAFLKGKVEDASRRAGKPQTPVLRGEMTHGFPLSLNPLLAVRRKRAASAAVELVGLGPERLTTDEAELCLDILRRGPHTEEEQAIEDALEALASGRLRASTFKVLLRPALRGRLPRPHAAPVQAPHVPQRVFRFNVGFERKNLPAREEARCRFAVEITGHPSGRSQVAKHLCVLADVSASMGQNKQRKYRLLRSALEKMCQWMAPDTYLTLVIFSTGASVVEEFCPHEDVDATRLLDKLERSGLKFYGRETHMGAAMELALDACRRFERIHPEHVARTYLMTDGVVHDFRKCIRLRDEAIRQGIEVHAFGFGEDCSRAALRLVTEGCLGGTVKVLLNLQAIEVAFPRAAVSTGNVFATGTKIGLTCGEDVLCNAAFTFRPKDKDVSDAISRSSDSWSFDGWGNFEKDRTYTLLFDTTVPPTEASETLVGYLEVKCRIQDEDVAETFAVLVRRAHAGTGSLLLNEIVTKAFDSCQNKDSLDPVLVLRRLTAKRDILRLEGADPAILAELDRQIAELEATGDLPRDSSGADRTVGDMISQEMGPVDGPPLVSPRE